MGATDPTERNCAWTAMTLEIARLEKATKRQQERIGHLERQAQDSRSVIARLLRMLSEEQSFRLRDELMELSEPKRKGCVRHPDPAESGGQNPAPPATRGSVPPMGRVPAPEDIPLPPAPPAAEPAPSPPGPIEDMPLMPASWADAWLLRAIGRLPEGKQP